MSVDIFLIILVLIIALVNIILVLNLFSRINRIEQKQETFSTPNTDLMASKILKQIRLAEKQSASKNNSLEKETIPKSTETYRIVHPIDEGEESKIINKEQAEVKQAAIDKLKSEITETPQKKFDRYITPSTKVEEEFIDKDQYRWR
jgi:hypothetical protein